MVDVVVLYLAASAALFAGSAGLLNTGNRWIALIFPLTVLAILRTRDSPDARLSGSLPEAAAQVAGAVTLAAMLMIGLDSMFGGQHAVSLAVRLALFGTVYLGTARMVLLSIRRQLMRNPARMTPTLVVGAGVVGERLVKRLLSESRYGLRPVGFIDASALPVASGAVASGVPVVGGIEDLIPAITRSGAKHVILGFSNEPDHVLVMKIRECAELGVKVSLVPRLFESVNGSARLDHVAGLPLLSLSPTDPRGWQFAVKHAFDRGFALVALVALAPLMVLLAVAVKLSTPGPALFSQRRVGRDGRTFDVFKFRTMRTSDDPHVFTPARGQAPGGVEGADRRTRFGRWLRRSSLDELPQFINVLRGDMSIVGPRPERPEFVQVFATEVDRYEDRHRVKSGITGWAQVNGLRGQTSIADRVEWDNYYIQNWSLGLDLRIVAMTIAEMFRLRG